MSLPFEPRKVVPDTEAVRLIWEMLDSPDSTIRPAQDPWWVLYVQDRVCHPRARYFVWCSTQSVLQGLLAEHGDGYFVDRLHDALHNSVHYCEHIRQWLAQEASS